MLGLKLTTDPRWANIAEMHLEEILIDHAFCEQKAASSGISLIVKYPDKPLLVDTITPIVAEEWGHFRKVLKEINQRGFSLGNKRKDEYVNRLQELQKETDNAQEILVERLLQFAMIEARSCERFRLLSIHLSDDYLRNFYHEFMVSEAGHYRTFIDLAKHYMPAEYVKERWQQLLENESQMIQTLTLRGNRIH